MKLKKSIYLILIALLISFPLLTNLKADESINKAEIYTTIKPIQSLIQAVMGDIMKAHLISPSDISPHHHNLKPSEIRNINNAKVIFYIDKNFESYLKKIIELDDNSKKFIALSMANNIKFLDAREDENWLSHDHDETHDHDEAHYHDDLEVENQYLELRDMHYWLDIDNAISMVSHIAKILSSLYPEHQAEFEQNSNNYIKRLEKLDGEIREELSEIKDKPFIVNHDAYQYIETRYNLSGKGSFSNSHQEPITINKIKHIRKLVNEHNIKCILVEYNEYPNAISTIFKETKDNRQNKINITQIDILGVEIAEGSDLYINLLRKIANDIKNCLQ